MVYGLVASKPASTRVGTCGQQASLRAYCYVNGRQVSLPPVVFPAFSSLVVVWTCDRIVCCEEELPQPKATDPWAVRTAAFTLPQAAVCVMKDPPAIQAGNWHACKDNSVRSAAADGFWACSDKGTLTKWLGSNCFFLDRLACGPSSLGSASGLSAISAFSRFKTPAFCNLSQAFFNLGWDPACGPSIRTWLVAQL